ncbi:MAG: LysM peptidoglycan-binding domain-containing protein [Chloroflexota bacterium]
MQRPGLIAPLTGLAATLVAGPILASVALAADPTVIVQAGDTLTSIGKRHDVDIPALVDLNDLVDPNLIFPGQRLRIAVEPAASAPAAPPASRVHTVSTGQNLTTIARQYGVTIAAIVKANAISDASRIYAGQRISIPAAGVSVAPAASTAPAPAAAPPAPRVHTVSAGQNLTTIARQYGVTIAAIVKANAISDASRIYAGQRISIPGSAPATTPTGTADMPASMATLVAERDAVRRMIVEEAGHYEVPAAFALAVAWQESGWQQGVVSSAGAVGVMQLMPDTADWVGEAMLGAGVQINDARWNIRAGVRLLSHYLDRYDGDRDRVLAAYYQGQRATDQHGIYAVTRPYIASIRVLERIFGG